MKSLQRGKSISKVEVQGVSSHGVWLYVSGSEYFLPYKTYPWFLNATVEQIYHVKLLFGFHLWWPDLDIDLELDALKYPEKYPLVYDGCNRQRSVSCIRETKAKKYGKKQ